jgi:hypothetical protein
MSDEICKCGGGVPHYKMTGLPVLSIPEPPGEAELPTLRGESTEWAQIGAVRISASGKKYRCVAFIVGFAVVLWEPLPDDTKEGEG